MARPIVMPSLGMYTTEGTVTAWLREPGSQVAAGEPVVEVTTEKAVYQVEAPGDGILHAVAEIGAVVPDQGLIGHVLAPGEDPPAAAPPTTAPAGGAQTAPPTRAFAPAPPTPGGELRASPAARRLAQDRGIDITTVVGTGPGGRIVEADVMAAMERRSAAPAAPGPVGPGRPAPAAAARNVRERIP